MRKMMEVTANDEGLNFIKLLKESLNKKYYQLILRGRHSDRRSVLGDKFIKRDEGHYNSPNDIPLNKAERIAIYIYKKEADQRPSLRVATDEARN